MPSHWGYREDLSIQNRVRRSYYEVLRDEMDQHVLTWSLVQSYKNFLSAGLVYPYSEKRELKPRARLSLGEVHHQNAFLIIMAEDVIPSIHKKYMRFFDSNKVTKQNLLTYKAIPFSLSLERNLKNLESIKFFDFFEKLLPIDYALLIQRDPSTKARNRYYLSHFHMKVDWPIADAAEDLARQLRYISKDLYEKGETYAEELQKKFFEYYCIPFGAGGRRTAAIVAAQYLRKLPFVSTVYVGSSETRGIIRLSERGVAKFVLMPLTKLEIGHLCESAAISQTAFRKNYLIAREGESGVAIFRVTYARTEYARPPEDGRIRELKPDLHWLTVESQHVLPKPGVRQFTPIAHNIIYS
ncbi:MAG: hypothetical protein HZB23_08635 [Deltaproteobacteria bacterium]|nr:hypothetical protein [Deltaproteobacteria bacterium]